MLCTTLTRFENTKTCFLTCDTLPGDVGNCLHTVVTITQTVIKNAMRDNRWMEGKKKEKKKERRHENDIQTHVTQMNN